jgi:hypothetical protein
MRRSISVSLAIVICVGAAPLWANWGSTAGGSVASGNFRSFGTEQVEMLHENLVIRLHRDRASVTVDYVLHNTGAAVDVRAGFPSLGVRSLDESGKPTEQKEIEDYGFLADGLSVGFKREKGDPTPLKALYEKKFVSMINTVDEEDQSGKSDMVLEWFVSTVHFAAGQIRHIHISYESLYAYCSGGYSDDSDDCADRFAYVLSTGAAWKGPIMDGRVTIEAITVDPNTLQISPRNRFVRKDRSFSWEFHNLKPAMADNIVVSMNDASSTIARYDNDYAETEGIAGYYVYGGGRYFYMTQRFTPSGASAGEEYGPEKVREMMPETEWRTAHAPGIGDTLTLAPKTAGHIDQVGIIPGCGRDKNDWFSHARINEIEVTVNGNYSHTASLTDEYISFGPGSDKTYHWVNLPTYPGDAKEIRLTILSVYPGASDQVTCVDKVMLRRWLPSRPDIASGIDGHKLP